ncbi:MAG: methyltransferase domain-containing protein, partial [Pseudomonadota bacterium]|nr:methyltransferase domain-containing protein [Pseudomonadota bacterium]
MTDTKPANADQREFWSDIKGELWVELQPRIDPMLAPFGEKAIEALDLMPGERVIEIGCGNGTTTLALAERVGAEGEVLAVDLSRPMLNMAMERGKTSGHPVR